MIRNRRKVSLIGDTGGAHYELMRRIERNDRIRREKLMGFTPTLWQRFKHWVWCIFHESQK